MAIQLLVALMKIINNTKSGNEPGTLTVSKEDECREVPANNGVCAFTTTSPNFPDHEDYPITLTVNSPNPSNFHGRSSGTPVDIRAG